MIITTPNQAGTIVLRTGQFAWRPALIENPGTKGPHGLEYGNFTDPMNNEKGFSLPKLTLKVKPLLNQKIKSPHRHGKVQKALEAVLKIVTLG